MDDKVMILREAGSVKRLHTVPIHGAYTVANHSWGMAMMAIMLHPDPSRDLIKACVLHDAGERYTGDVPAPVKWIVPDLAQVLEKMERQALAQMGAGFTLTVDDLRWLKALDLLDLYLFCVEESRMGNRNTDGVRRVCLEVMQENDIPKEIVDWLNSAQIKERCTGGWIS